MRFEGLGPLGIENNDTPERREKGAAMLNLHLQLFAEGAGEAQQAGGKTAAEIDFAENFKKYFGGDPGPAAPDTRAKAQSAAQDAAAENKQETVQEGPAAETQPHENPDTDFEGLIKGKFKDAFNKRVQGIINERFKNANAKQAQQEAQHKAFVEAVGPYLRKLGVKDPNDLEAIRQAALDDATNFRDAAIEQNKTIEEMRQQYLNDKKTAEEKALKDEQLRQLQNQQRAAAEQARRRNVFAGWEAEAEQIRESDPTFDLKNEIRNNEEFRKALNAGMGVKFAYNATHFDERMAATAGAVARQTAINTAQNLAANRARPAEGGLKQGAAAQARIDYNALPDEEILKIFNSYLH